MPLRAGELKTMELNQEERGRLAVAIVNTLDEWGVGAAEQVRLIGLPEDTRPREITRYRRGTALPDDEEIIQRCQHIIGIQHALQLIFAHNPQFPGLWITDTANRHFDGSPVDVMLREGLGGMARVRKLLEPGSDWE